MLAAKKLIKEYIKKILRTPFFFPVIERYVLSQISTVNTKPDSELGILVLDVERFWPGTLDRLGERTKLFILPSDCRNRLHSLFFTAEEAGMLRRYDTTQEFRRKEKGFVSFLRRLIPRLASRLAFDCVVTCNYKYVQNKLIAKACKATPIPFVDLNREAKQDVNLNERFKNKFKTMGHHMEFFGNAICVYNENMKTFLTEMDVCSPEDIHVTGALRTDSLVDRIRPLGSDDECKQMTLFSFRHLPIGGVSTEYRAGFSTDGTRGYVQLFNDVHSAFAELAKKNPKTKFVIKLKWLHRWEDYVRRAMETSGFPLDELSNLAIVGEDEDAIDLILKSHVVIGLNSMTLLQARLANRVAIIPLFGEIVDKYPDSLQYRTNLSEFLVADSREELIHLVQKQIKAPESFPLTPGIFDEYIGFTDGNNLDRVMSVLLKECARSRDSSGKAQLSG